MRADLSCRTWKIRVGHVSTVRGSWRSIYWILVWEWYYRGWLLVADLVVSRGVASESGLSGAFNDLLG